MSMNVNSPKLGFRNASVNEQIATVRRLATRAVTLPENIREQVLLGPLDEALAEAEAAVNDLARLRAQTKAAVSRQVAAMARLRENAMRSSIGISTWVKGDAAAMLGAGLSLAKSKRIRTGPPGVATELRARDIEGGVSLLWRNPMRRSWFTLQCAEGAPVEGNWQSNSEWYSGKGRFTFTGLRPNTVYWFRVKAHNTNGESAWSDAVSGRPV